MYTQNITFSVITFRRMSISLVLYLIYAVNEIYKNYSVNRPIMLVKIILLREFLVFLVYCILYNCIIVVCFGFLFFFFAI